MCLVLPRRVSVRCVGTQDTKGCVGSSTCHVTLRMFLAERSGTPILRLLQLQLTFTAMQNNLVQ